MCETRTAIKTEKNKLLPARQNDILTDTEIFFPFTHFVLWHFAWHKHLTNSWPILMYCCLAIADMTHFNLKLAGFQMLPFSVNQGWMTSKNSPGKSLCT